MNASYADFDTSPIASDDDDFELFDPDVGLWGALKCLIDNLDPSDEESRQMPIKYFNRICEVVPVPTKWNEDQVNFGTPFTIDERSQLESELNSFLVMGQNRNFHSEIVFQHAIQPVFNTITKWIGLNTSVDPPVVPKRKWQPPKPDLTVASGNLVNLLVEVKVPSSESKGRPKNPIERDKSKGIKQIFQYALHYNSVGIWSAPDIPQYDSFFRRLTYVSSAVVMMTLNEMYILRIKGTANGRWDVVDGARYKFQEDPYENRRRFSFIAATMVALVRMSTCPSLLWFHFPSNR